MINFRVSPDEYATVERAAEIEGLTVGSYIRSTLLLVPRKRLRRRPRADVAALAKLTAELNRVGSNINQIARAANYGGQPEGAWLRDALAHLLEVMKAARAAMGFET